ncbi:MAG: HAD-IA family hydrolase [Fibrobacter sp.]|nr:HAD-IA family hydrolase [Fibrobacter sp.]
MDALEQSIYLRYKELIAESCAAPLDLPQQNPRQVHLEDIMGWYDVFCFDGFGTLYNRGDFLYEGALEWYRKLRAAGKQLRLITNAASNVDSALAEDAAKRGFDFTAAETISSGSLLQKLLEKLRRNSPAKAFSQAYYLGRPSGVNVLHACGIEAVENPREPIVAISSNVATEETFAHALEILKRPGAHLFVLNSDAWAPNIDGTRSPVSGALSEQLRLAAGPDTYYLGKPFPEIFNRIKESVPANSRILMIGDTLGTDVMGAAFAGIDSALVVGRNVPAADLDADEKALGIRPTWYLTP